MDAKDLAAIVAAVTANIAPAATAAPAGKSWTADARKAAGRTTNASAPAVKATPIPENESELDRLRRENEAMRNRLTGKVTLKVSEKGAVSVYGLGRFPVTLYRSQMETLLAHGPQIAAFITANAGQLTVRE
jgi:hypothetical protein